jgi:hypothetical protein
MYLGIYILAAGVLDSEEGIWAMEFVYVVLFT